jgi:REP element-mobilizing transposase RayT
MRKKRVITDVGIYHIYQQANSRVIIFYDDEDRLHFLSLVAESARTNGAVIYAYVLMDNHWHLLVNVKDLTSFVKRYLMSYVRWYNRKYSKRGNLCNGPYSSSPKNSIQSIISCTGYILNNPVKAGMVSQPFHYKWSSANQYFNNDSKGSRLLYIDDTIVKIYFSNLTEFHEYLNNPQPYINDFREERDLEIPIKYSDLTERLLVLLNKRSLYELSRNELIVMIKQFCVETRATYIQLASLFHVSYTFVRDVVKGRITPDEV